MERKLDKMAFALTALAALALLGPAALAAGDGVYYLQLNYDNGAITLKNLEFMPGTISPTRIQPGTGYRAELISLTGGLLYEFIFDIPLTISVDTIDPETGQFTGGTMQLNRADFSLRIPYFPDGKTINIYDPDGNSALEIDVSPLAQACGDGTCGEEEGYLICPQDCPSGSADGFCDRVRDSITDPDCGPGEDPDEGELQTNLFLIAALILIAIFTLLLLIKRKKGKRETPPYTYRPPQPGASSQ